MSYDFTCFYVAKVSERSRSRSLQLKSIGFTFLKLGFEGFSPFPFEPDSGFPTVAGYRLFPFRDLYLSRILSAAYFHCFRISEHTVGSVTRLFAEDGNSEPAFEFAWIFIFGGKKRDGSLSNQHYAVKLGL
jgi:hypothetical protein